jgi:hypothetical protein
LEVAARNRESGAVDARVPLATKATFDLFALSDHERQADGSDAHAGLFCHSPRQSGMGRMEDRRRSGPTCSEESSSLAVGERQVLEMPTGVFLRARIDRGAEGADWHDSQSWGGTPAESWTSRGTLESDAEFKSILDAGTKLLSPYPKIFEDFEQQLAQWRQDSDKAESECAPVPTAPTVPDDPRRNPWRPSGLSNAMVLPLTPYAIRGVIWYQGESNSCPWFKSGIASRQAASIRR